MKKFIACILSVAMLAVMTIISILAIDVSADDENSSSYIDIDNWDIKNAMEFIDEDDTIREYGGDFYNERFNNICPMKYNDIITIFGTDLLLYPTFINQDQALKNISVKLADFLNILASENGLDPLIDENLDEYESAAYIYMNNRALSRDEDSDADLFLRFIALYRNKERNNEIKEKYSSYNDAKKQENVSASLLYSVPTKDQEDFVSGMLLNEISLLLPNYTIHEFESMPKVQKLIDIYESNSNVSRASYKYTLNVRNAIEYASTYAEGANIWEWNYFSKGDCTNFVSQIIYAGGIPMDYSKPNPWYYRSAFDYSTRWTVANDFAKYWGVNYKTRNHRSFAAKLSPGDFIAIDFDNDGTWNHWGFVTAKESSEKMWSGYCYYDYKVAQHTSDYHLWTSTEKNKWEKKTNEGDALGILYSKNVNRGLIP